MYGRSVGSSSQFTTGNQTDDSSEAGDSPRFAETVAGMERGGSSSEPAASYSLVSEPPIREIDRESFLRGVERFYAMISGTSPRTQKSTRTSSPRRLSAQRRLLEVTPTPTTIQISQHDFIATGWATKLWGF